LCPGQQGGYIYIYIYISKGYASCRRPLDVDWGLVISGLAAQLETWEHTGQGYYFSGSMEEIRSRSKMCLSRDQLLAQNFDAVLAVVVRLAGDTIFVKFCHDALSHILRHPRSIQTRDVVGMGWDGSGWVGMDGDGWEGMEGYIDIPSIIDRYIDT
jgi:hypothetical protein